MLHMNRVTLLGHAGRDPEGRKLQDGERTASFTLATTRRWKGQGGEAVEKTEWHRIVVYGGAVQPAEDMVRKGAVVLVEVRLATREFNDRKGNRRRVTEVIVAGPQGLVNVLTPRAREDRASDIEEPGADGEHGDGSGDGHEDV